MKMSCIRRGWWIAALALIGILALGGLVMLLWNWLVPTLFDGGREIGYLQAMGVLLLSRVLFGGFRGRGCHAFWHRRRWERMTPEERERFRKGMRECCGGPDQQEPDAQTG